MDISSLGIAGVAAITVICYLVGLCFKLAPGINDKVIPVVCGLAGAAVGLVWFFCGFPDYPAGDPITAVAVGIVSGLAATGINQVYKQLSKGD